MTVKKYRGRVYRIVEKGTYNCKSVYNIEQRFLFIFWFIFWFTWKKYILTGIDAVGIDAERDSPEEIEKAFKKHIDGIESLKKRKVL